jgi:hypothetical protein
MLNLPGKAGHEKHEMHAHFRHDPSTSHGVPQARSPGAAKAWRNIVDAECRHWNGLKRRALLE